MDVITKGTKKMNNNNWMTSKQLSGELLFKRNFINCHKIIE